MARKKDGSALFDEYFQDHYHDQWPDLLQAMQQDRKHYLALTQDLSKEYHGISGVISSKDAKGSYFIDPASIYPVLALDIQPGHCVYDACAAPGGKSLLILRLLRGEGHLFCSDASRDRMHRLIHNLEAFGVHKNYQTWQHDALKTSDVGLVDRVLLDAPCSSERHWIEKHLLADWRIGRTKHLAIKQHALLCRVWEKLRVGGKLVYSTCSISPEENDKVIAKFLKKRDGMSEFRIQFGEKTQFGHIILPHQYQGAGPVYYAVLIKNS